MQHALKEWPKAIKALETGQMILLFRKGGLHEKGSCFRIPTTQALLFPSFEHEKISLLQSSSSSGERHPPYRPGDRISITSWVEFRDLLKIKDPRKIPELSPFHIWTDEYLKQKLSWKPERPLFALLCLTHQFHSPLHVEYKTHYGGCKSWIDLDQDLTLPRSIPVKTEQEFSQTLDHLRMLLH